jgi:predicted Zn-ribbon and HTH transcriptional regulator
MNESHDENNRTVRRRLAELLSLGDWDVRALSQEMRLREKEIVEHLPHVAKTVKAAGRRFVIVPAECLGCGFLFENRVKYAKPGRCPKCKRDRIQSPMFRVE